MVTGGKHLAETAELHTALTSNAAKSTEEIVPLIRKLKGMRDAMVVSLLLLSLLARVLHGLEEEKGVGIFVGGSPHHQKKMYITSIPEDQTILTRKPTVLGIGGPKTGSTSLGQHMKDHPNVEVGSAALGGRNEVSDLELYVLSRNKNLLQEGVKAYEHFFTPLADSIKATFEKTPEYSGLPSVPVRARAILGDHTNLIFTIRDSEIADMSHYFWYLLTHQPDQFRDLTYFDWVHARVSNYRTWHACREKHFKTMILPDADGRKDWTTYADLYNKKFSFSIDASSSVEGELDHACGDQPITQSLSTVRNGYKVLAPHLLGILNTDNIHRWRTYFPNPSTFLCVADRDQFCSPESVYERVDAFIGVPYVATTETNSSSIGTGGGRTQQEIDKQILREGKGRLEAHYRSMGWDPKEIDEALLLLRELLSATEDTAYLLRECPEYNKLLC